jgi:hypothetical protein
MSRRGVYALVERGLLVPIYLDRRPRFNVAEVQALVESRRRSAVPGSSS